MFDSIGALRRGHYALVVVLTTVMTIGNVGLLGPVGRASAASTVTVSATNALTGAAAASLGVAATPAAGGAPIVGTTGGDGKVQLSLPAGQYVFGPSEAASVRWLPRPFKAVPPVSVDGVSAPAPVAIEVVPVAATGTVRDAGGAAVQGASVVLFGLDRRALGDARTRPDGSFRIGGATRSDSYLLVANPPEGNSALSSSEPKSISVSVQNGQIATPADAGAIALPAATKFVHIRVEAPGLTVGPTMVNAQRAGDTSQPGLARRLQDPTGQAGFDLTLRPGSWDVAIAPAGDNTSATWVAPPPKTVTFTQPAEVVEKIELVFGLGGPQLSGRVVDGQGRALEGAAVQLSNKDHTLNIPAAPGAGGTFKIGGISGPGTYYLAVQPPLSSTAGLLPAEPREITVETDGSGRLLFTVAGDPSNSKQPAPIALADIVLRAASKTINGTISRADGKELGATIVNAFPAQGGGPGSAFFNTRATVSGSQGSFTLSVAPGTWQVNIGPDFGSNGSADWIYAGQPVTVSFAGDSTPETKSTSFAVSAAEYTLTAQVLLPNGGKPIDNSVFLNVHNRSGFGRSEPVRDGLFSMRVPAGTYEIDVADGEGRYGPPAGGFGTLSVPNPASPDSKTVKLGANGVITLTQRGGVISGNVVDGTGHGLANINVNAWNPITNDRSAGQTGTDGKFTLRVADGAYDVDAFPGPDAPYARQGAPQRITVKNGAADRSPTFSMAAASATVTVRAVDASGNLISDANGFAFATKAGEVSAKLVAAAGDVKPGVPTPGAGESTPSAGAPIGNGQPLVNGVATLKLPAADGIVIGIGFPPGSNYLGAQSSQISTRTTGSQTVNITLSSPDVTISGKLLNGSTAVTGVRAQVFAMSQGGGAQADVDQATGTFKLKVQSGRTWFLGLFLPPDSNLSWFPSAPPQVDLASAQSGSTVEFNFSVTSADGTVSGTVKDPSGNAMPGTFVAVLAPSGSAGKPPRFVAGAETNARGEYAIKVQSGQAYQVEAHIAPDRGFEKGYIAPAPQTCSLTSWTNGVCSQDFRFRAADATISGSVSSASGGPLEAFVRAWSDNGGNAFGRSAADGTFALSATAGEKWYLQAIQESTAQDGTKSFTVSPVKTLTTSAGANAGIALVVGSATTLPNALTTTFDATSMQVLTLSNGVKLTIPAGALATSGQVTVRAVPKSELPADKTSQPLDIGYAFEATDSNGAAITKFNASVKIEIPYDPSRLGSGSSESDLVPSYYDSATGAWKKAENVTLDQTNHVAIVLVDHFTDFAVLATTSTRSTQAAFKLYLPSSTRAGQP